MRLSRCKKDKARVIFPRNATDIRQIRPSQDLEPSLVKTEGEEDVKTSVTVKHEKNGAKTEAKSETTAAVTGKTSKKRKTKEEKEAEAMPLRARTPGVRMLVGAHVSAAKGEFIIYGLLCAELTGLYSRCL